MVHIQDKNLDMRQIADSGQIFRFNSADDGSFLLRAGDRKLVINGSYEEGYDLDCSPEEFEAFWKHYFDLETDYSAFIRTVPEDDPFLRAAVRAAYGIRILNQDPWEMLISFIISQRKNIPAIRSCIEKICERFGKDGAFPTPGELAAASEEELSQCSLGYRAPYVKEAAEKTALGIYDPEGWRELDDEELRRELLSVKGVGIKVANCAMLFGYHRIGAFPVDVWISRIIEEKYGGSFPLDRYEGFAGVIQQYMFYFGRNSVDFSGRS